MIVVQPRIFEKNSIIFSLTYDNFLWSLEKSAITFCKGRSNAPRKMILLMCPNWSWQHMKASVVVLNETKRWCDFRSLYYKCRPHVVRCHMRVVRMLSVGHLRSRCHYISLWKQSVGVNESQIESWQWQLMRANIMNKASVD